MPIEVDPIIGLFKFGEREHMEQLAGGKLYLNTLRFYAKLEASDPRHDPWEGAATVLLANGASLLMDGRPLATIDGHVRFSSTDSPLQHVFCMFAVRESNAENLFRAADLGFGDSWVCFKEADEFLRRVEIAAAQSGRKYRTGLVEYIDQVKYSGTMGPFRKRKQFKMQSEARIVIGPGGEGPLELEIGSIRDLVGTVNDIRDLSKFIRIERPNVE